MNGAEKYKDTPLSDLVDMVKVLGTENDVDTSSSKSQYAALNDELTALFIKLADGSDMNIPEDDVIVTEKTVLQVGDVLKRLIYLCMTLDIDIEDALAEAYHEDKQRETASEEGA